MGSANSIRAIRIKHSWTVDLWENLANRLRLEIIGQEKPINMNTLGATVFGTNRARPWDKPRDKRDGWGSSLGRLSRQGRQKNEDLFQGKIIHHAPPLHSGQKALLRRSRRVYILKPPAAIHPPPLEGYLRGGGGGGV